MRDLINTCKIPTITQQVDLRESIHSEGEYLEFPAAEDCYIDRFLDITMINGCDGNAGKLC